MSETVMVGIDGSKQSRSAVDYALSEAKRSNARLVIGHVIEWSPYTFNTPEENEMRHKRKEEELQMVQERVLKPLLASLEAEETEIIGVVRHGQVAETLHQMAKEQGACQLVIGRIGQRTISTFVFGSVVTKLIQLTDIPVTVVP